MKKLGFLLILLSLGLFQMGCAPADETPETPAPAAGGDAEGEEMTPVDGAGGETPAEGEEAG